MRRSSSVGGSKLRNGLDRNTPPSASSPTASREQARCFPPAGVLSSTCISSHSSHPIFSQVDECEKPAASAAEPNFEELILQSELLLQV